MMDQSNLKSIEVAIIKSETPREGILEGIRKLGGISKFISNEDQVFLKINLRLPCGFPVNINFDVVEVLIELCKEAGAKKIYVGSYPNKEIDTKTLSEMLDLSRYFDSIGAELVFLDDQEKFPLTSININNKQFKVPELILNSDKVISINQLSVDPLFQCTLSLLNSYSIVPDKYQTIQKISKPGKDYLRLDQYKSDLVSNILDVFSIKKPSLVINDMFYVLEGAGPYIYKDSKINKTNLLILGSDAVAVDLITLKILNLDPFKNNLISESQLREIGYSNLNKINILGESLDDTLLDVEFCVYKLEDINVQNTFIKTGRFCAGCYNKAYHLLNLMKTHMTKDLKYIIKQSYLIGENPPEPQNPENVILFGDCAINSTKEHNFRKITVEKPANILEEAKKKLKRDKKQSSQRKIKQKTNKQILELFGCPPDISSCINSLLNYYGKSQVPNLSFYNQLTDTYQHQKTIHK
ncbi:MAG: DUF362 domain-containing protein [Candidatus Thorarchaeota archaeon]